MIPLVPSKDRYRTEESITVDLPKDHEPIQVKAIEPTYNNLMFEVSAQETFYFSLPGTYELRSGTLLRTVQVDKQHYLDFGSEFGFFFVGAFSLVMGMLIWMLRKKSS